MIIRNYESQDYDTLLALTYKIWEPVFATLEQSSNPEIYEVLVPDWKAEQKRSIDSITSSDNTRVLLACDDRGAILGFAAIRFHPEDFLGEIHMIGVDPGYQARGIGTALSEQGFRIMRENGFRLAMVETGGDPAHAAARRAYEKMGFELWPIARYFKRI